MDAWFRRTRKRQCYQVHAQPQFELGLFGCSHFISRGRAFPGNEPAGFGQQVRICVLQQCVERGDAASCHPRSWWPAARPERGKGLGFGHGSLSRLRVPIHRGPPRRILFFSILLPTVLLRGRAEKSSAPTLENPRSVPISSTEAPRGSCITLNRAIRSTKCCIAICSGDVSRVRLTRVLIPFHQKIGISLKSLLLGHRQAAYPTQRAPVHNISIVTRSHTDYIATLVRLASDLMDEVLVRLDGGLGIRGGEYGPVERRITSLAGKTSVCGGESGDWIRRRIRSAAVLPDALEVPVPSSLIRGLRGPVRVTSSNPTIATSSGTVQVHVPSVRLHRRREPNSRRVGTGRWVPWEMRTPGRTFRDRGAARHRGREVYAGG